MKTNDFDIHLQDVWDARGTDITRLSELAKHESHIVCADVARNKHITREIHQKLINDSPRGVVCQALIHPLTTREQYEAIFHKMAGQSYKWLYHPTLARHPLTTTEELHQLLNRRKWNIDIAILNNHKGRDAQEYKQLIVSLLPPPAPEGANTEDDHWSPLHRLAYFHTYGVKWRA